MILTRAKIDQLDLEIDKLKATADKTRLKLVELSKQKSALEFLFDLKFEESGFHPSPEKPSGTPLNLIEQINQTFTYLASYQGANLLFELHPDLEQLKMNLGTRGGSDIESENCGGIAVEVFAAVSPSNNNKLNKDIEKVKAISAQYRYVFFICPDYKKREWLEAMSKKSGVSIWSLGCDSL